MTPLTSNTKNVNSICVLRKLCIAGLLFLVTRALPKKENGLTAVLFLVVRILCTAANVHTQGSLRNAPPHRRRRRRRRGRIFPPVRPARYVHFYVFCIFLSVK